VRPLLPGDKEQPGTILGMADPKRPANDSEAITWLVEQVPELRPLLEEHLAESELLSYVVFERGVGPFRRTRSGFREGTSS
jgi:hypothetical protein